MYRFSAEEAAELKRLAAEDPRGVRQLQWFVSFTVNLLANSVIR